MIDNFITILLILNNVHILEKNSSKLVQKIKILQIVPYILNINVKRKTFLASFF